MPVWLSHRRVASAAHLQLWPARDAACPCIRQRSPHHAGEAAREAIRRKAALHEACAIVADLRGSVAWPDWAQLQPSVGGGAAARPKPPSRAGASIAHHDLFAFHRHVSVAPRGRKEQLNLCCDRGPCNCSL